MAAWGVYLSKQSPRSLGCVEFPDASSVKKNILSLTETVQSCFFIHQTFNVKGGALSFGLYSLLRSQDNSCVVFVGESFVWFQSVFFFISFWLPHKWRHTLECAQNCTLASDYKRTQTCSMAMLTRPWVNYLQYKPMTAFIMCLTFEVALRSTFVFPWRWILS